MTSERTLEFRSLRDLELRYGDNGPTIVGHAAVFNSPSREMMGIYGKFREVILPTAFDRMLSERSDVHALVDHDPSKVIGRTRSGTLRLSKTAKGLLAEIDPPDTSIGRDVLTSIRRRDIDGMSFGFFNAEDSWDFGDEIPTRYLKSVEVRDVSPVAYPAYENTEVAVRSLELHRQRDWTPGPSTAEVLAWLKQNRSMRHG